MSEIRYPSDIGRFIIGLSPVGGYPPLPGIDRTIPSYLYGQYKDSDDLQAFVDAYNTLTQQYVNWFNYVILPDYTNRYIAGAMLDWVAEGLYGIFRPALASGRIVSLGPANTWVANVVYPNEIEDIRPPSYLLNDDFFKRVITWHFFKGDGKYFTIRWLKRRVLRFLLGVDGTNVDASNTYRISVTFGGGGAVTIRLVSVLASVASGAICNTAPCNIIVPNIVVLALVHLAPFAAGPMLQAAVAAGILELPFQYDFTVQIL